MMCRTLLALCFCSAAAFAQSCVPAGMRIGELTNRLVDSIGELQSADPAKSETLIQGMKSSLTGLQGVTSCFAARAQTGHDVCLAQVGQTTLELGRIEEVEKQLGGQLNTLEVDLVRASKDQSTKEEAFRKVQADIENTRRSLESRRSDLRDYDWVKYICPPCKLIADAITNDENTIRRLEADMRMLQAQGGSLNLSKEMVEKDIRDITALRASLRATMDRIVQLRERTHNELGEMKGTTAFLTQANIFWRGVGQILTIRAGPELQKAAKESQRSLGETTGSVSFARPGTRPQVAANSLRETLARFAKATDDGSNFLLNSDTNYCTVVPRSAEHLPLSKRNTTAPALAAFRDRLYMAFQSNDGTNSLTVTSSGDGDSFTPVRAYPGIRMGSAPAMAEFDGMLVIAFQANDASHSLYVTMSADGASFSAPARRYADSTGASPALATFNRRLYLAFQANDASHTLHLSSTGDGVNFTPGRPYPGVLAGSAPALTVFNGQLYVAFQANDPGHALFVMSSGDGTNFTPQKGQAGITMGSAPALTVLNNRLRVGFQADDASHSFYVTNSANGTGFVTPAVRYRDLVAGSAAGMTVFKGRLFAAFRPDDFTNAVSVSSSEGDTFTGVRLVYLGSPIAELRGANTERN
jgi:hypothetical protein